MARLPDEDRLDETDIGKLERGETHWSRRIRREGFRAVLSVQTDADLGFYCHRRSRSRPMAGQPIISTISPPVLGPTTVRSGGYAKWDNEGPMGRIDPLDNGVVSVARTPHEGPVAPELVVYFLEQLPGHYKADMFLGPRHLIPTVATQARLIDDLVRAADRPVRRGLLGAGVPYSALLGWLYQDAGEIHESARWRNIALDMAHRAADPQLVSYALTNKAMLAVDQGDGRAILDYAEAALTDEARLCPKVRVLGLVHQAHGHSFLGDRTAVDDALDLAEALIDKVDDEHPWGNSCHRTAGYIDVQRATAYGRLKAHREAAQMWERVLGAAPDSAGRDNSVFWTRQAVALAALPEPERVVKIAAAVAPFIDETGSARFRRELMALPGHADAWKATASGRALDEIIAGIA